MSRRLARFTAARARAVVAVGAACSSAPRSAPPIVGKVAPERAAKPSCALAGVPEIVVATPDGATLERWDLPDDGVLESATLPDDAGYAHFRAVLHDAKADVLHPIADPPVIATDAQREIWRREDLNVAVAYSGEAGTIRPIHCLEALLFAKQHARHDELVAPTEFAALILKKTVGGDPRVRIYYGHANVEFPPHQVYGLDQAAADRKDGWRIVTHLHNHTIRTNGRAPALGVTAPSTNDVEFLRNALAERGLESAWVTNGVFTIELPVAALARYEAAVR